MNILIEALLRILDEGYKEAQAEFELQSDPTTAAETIKQFRQLVDRNQAKGQERNIDSWRKNGWLAFAEFVDKKSQQQSITQLKRSKSTGKSVTIGEDEDWLIVVPVDKAASCYHGKNTDWCTTKPMSAFFERYVYTNNVILLYFLQLKTGNKWAIACYTDQLKFDYFDVNDRTLSASEFESQTGINPIPFQKAVTRGNLHTSIVDEIAPGKERWSAAKEYVDSHINHTSKRSEELERNLLILNDTDSYLTYCLNVNTRWAQIEPTLTTSLTVNGVVYATNIIKQRWPKLETLFIKMFSSSPTNPHPDELAFVITNMLVPYCINLIGGDHRWPEVETLIIANWPTYAGLYADKLIKGRWIEFEQNVADTFLIQYAATLPKTYKDLEQRIGALAIPLDGTQRIQLNRYVSKFYGVDNTIPNTLIKIVSRVPEMVIKYATYNKVRLELGEHLILNTPKLLCQYISAIKPALPDSEFERVLLSINITSEYLNLPEAYNPFLEYIEVGLGGQRWVGFEHKLERLATSGQDQDVVVRLAVSYLNLVGGGVSWTDMGYPTIGSLLSTTQHLNQQSKT